MQKRIIFNNFNKGQLSNLEQQTLNEKGFKIFQNFILNPITKTISRRPGTILVQTSPNYRNLDYIVRLIPYTNSDGSVTLLEFGYGYITPYKTGYSDFNVVPASTNLTSLYDSKEKLQSLNYLQIGSLLYLFQESVPPQVISTNANGDLSISALSFVATAFNAENTNLSSTLTISATSGNITISSSLPLFDANDVDRYLQIAHVNSAGKIWYGKAKITSVINATQVNASVTDPFYATAASYRWALGSWSKTQGWPTFGAVFQSRLYLSGVKSYPDRFWASQLNTMANFSLYTKDASGAFVVSDKSAIEISLSTSDSYIKITNFITGNNISLITNKGLYKIDQQNITSASITITKILDANINAVSGSAISVEGGIVYANSKNSTIGMLAYGDSSNSYIQNITFSNKYNNSTITRIALLSTDWNMIFALNSMGKLFSINTTPDKAISTYDFSGRIIMDICSYTDKSANYIALALYMPMNSTCSIEKFSSLLVPEGNNIPNGPVNKNLDSSSTASTYQNTFYSYNYNHINDNYTLYSVTDSNIIYSNTVLSGRIRGSVPNPAKYTIGIAYDSILQTTSLNVNEFSIDKKKRLAKVIITTTSGKGGSYSVDNKTFYSMDFGPTEVTNNIITKYLGGWSQLKNLTLLNNSISNFNISAISIDIDF